MDRMGFVDTGAQLRATRRRRKAPPKRFASAHLLYALARLESSNLDGPSIVFVVPRLQRRELQSGMLVAAARETKITKSERAAQIAAMAAFCRLTSRICP